MTAQQAVAHGRRICAAGEPYRYATEIIEQ